MAAFVMLFIASLLTSPAAETSRIDSLIENLAIGDSHEKRRAAELLTNDSEPDQVFKRLSNFAKDSTRPVQQRILVIDFTNRTFRDVAGQRSGCDELLLELHRTQTNSLISHQAFRGLCRIEESPVMEKIDAYKFVLLREADKLSARDVKSILRSLTEASPQTEEVVKGLVFSTTLDFQLRLEGIDTLLRVGLIKIPAIDQFLKSLVAEPDFLERTTGLPADQNKTEQLAAARLLHKLANKLRDRVDEDDLDPEAETAFQGRLESIAVALKPMLAMDSPPRLLFIEVYTTLLIAAGPWEINPPPVLEGNTEDIELLTNYVNACTRRDDDLQNNLQIANVIGIFPPALIKCDTPAPTRYPGWLHGSSFPPWHRTWSMWSRRTEESERSSWMQRVPWFSWQTISCQAFLR